MLRHLATNAGRVVTKDELLEANWPGVTVTEDSLTQCISEIRRVLGDAGRDLIRTVPRRGYMIVFPELPRGRADPPAAAKPIEVSPYRHLRVAVSALLSAAVVAVWGVWMLTTGLRSLLAAVPAPPATASRGPVVAVLPFENNTGDTSQDMLADGLTQAMISALGRFDHLRVLSRGVTSAYKGRVPDTTDLGRTLARTTRSTAI